ncbi:hypothetical protein DM02DRAFT_355616 [Periconia macrospinosa]|uniref:Uncharacterized protein n=1 Tax=Periconia macrospinosa TaxID=97972 RepID=A0A2V1EAJ8_9PLEO|nr:hypothetical protein DM02DRAFT_355616 [Periconia macrospinosa]
MIGAVCLLVVCSSHKKTSKGNTAGGANGLQIVRWMPLDGPCGGVGGRRRLVGWKYLWMEIFRGKLSKRRPCQGRCGKGIGREFCPVKQAGPSIFFVCLFPLSLFLLCAAMFDVALGGVYGYLVLSCWGMTCGQGRARRRAGAVAGASPGMMGLGDWISLTVLRTGLESSRPAHGWGVCLCTWASSLRGAKHGNEIEKAPFFT